MLYMKNALNNFAKFTENHIRHSPFFGEIKDLMSETKESTSLHMLFANFVKFFIKTFLTEYLPGNDPASTSPYMYLVECVEENFIEYIFSVFSVAYQDKYLLLSKCLEWL